MPTKQSHHLRCVRVSGTTSISTFPTARAPESTLSNQTFVEDRFFTISPISSPRRYDPCVGAPRVSSRCTRTRSNTPTRRVCPTPYRTVAGHRYMPRVPCKSDLQPQFRTEFTMSFDDDSRVVIKEGQPPPPLPSSRPASSSKGEKRKSTAAPPTLNDGGRKPDGFGTVTCVQTFPTGLVVSTGSDGAVSYSRE